MEMHRGDRVLVNVAPFIGSNRRGRTAIPCRVTAVDGSYVEVCTEAPCREISLRVTANWIETTPRPGD
jgi:hypothetical protein